MTTFLKFINYLTEYKRKIQDEVYTIDRSIEEYRIKLANLDQDKSQVRLFLEVFLPKKIKNKNKDIFEKKLDELLIIRNELVSQILDISGMILTFSNNYAIYALINPAKAFNFCVSALKVGVIQELDISKIMGSLFVNIAKKNEQYREWTKFYDEDGCFKITDEEIRPLYENFFEKTKKDLNVSKLDRLNVITDIELLYDDFKRGYKIIHSEQTDCNMASFAKLSYYYNNGEIINIPFDLEEFDKLLDECLIDEFEKRKIYDLIKEKMSLVKIDKTSKIDISENPNIIYLYDEDGVSYFEQDLLELDNSIRNRAALLISKINPQYFNKFRKVNTSCDAHMYEVVNKFYHIIFVEINNKYLVLGGSLKRDGYNKIINRYFTPCSQKYVSKLLNDSDEITLKRKKN